MAKGATSKSGHSLNLSLLILLSYLGTTLSDGEFPGSTWRGLGYRTWTWFKSGSSHLGYWEAGLLFLQGLVALALAPHHPAFSGLRKEVMKKLWLGG